VTIHWHGLHQRLTPHMDGVPYLTQCPIHPGNSFRYRMEADIAGTHMYHSHIGMASLYSANNNFVTNSI
jgi:L-ascorbate oxidase